MCREEPPESFPGRFFSFPFEKNASSYCIVRYYYYLCTRKRITDASLAQLARARDL